MSRTQVVLCAGSLGFTLLRLGGVALMPYLGTKAPYADIIMQMTGWVDRPQRLVIAEPGPWGTAWRVLADLEARERVARRVGQIVDSYPQPNHAKQLFTDLLEAPATTTHSPGWREQCVAEFLILQLLAFRGKPVWLQAGPDKRVYWRSPGYNKTAAEGVPARASFGAVAPQLPGLAARIRALPAFPPTTVHADAAAVPIPEDASDCDVFVDPPYEDTTGYATHVFEPAAVRGGARRWSARGARVVVCERQQVLTEPGWVGVEITGRASGKPSTWGGSEWLTMNFPPVQRSLFGAATSGGS